MKKRSGVRLSISAELNDKLDDARLKVSRYFQRSRSGLFGPNFEVPNNTMVLEMAVDKFIELLDKDEKAYYKRAERKGQEADKRIAQAVRDAEARRVGTEQMRD